ncbi:hypothetical protein ACFL2T_00565 [Elusimicrobiota bacterium]
MTQGLSGSPYNFEYMILDKVFSTADITSYGSRLKTRLAKLTKKWDDDLNAEWMIRGYLSVKMIYAATIMLTSLEYSREKNVQVVWPYLSYYSLFNCCRALLYSDTNVLWKDGKLASLSHPAVMKQAGSSIRAVNKTTGEAFQYRIDESREVREIFSYKFPANGIKGLSEYRLQDFDSLISDCRTLVELAQFNSECLEMSYGKHAAGHFTFNKDIIDNLFEGTGKDRALVIDDEDLYRIGYVCRKQPHPLNLAFRMTEGMTEDWFGSWCPEDDTEEDTYNPDSNWGIIFPCP